MFTGLVEGTGQIIELSPKGNGFLLTVKAGFSLEDTRVGDSIAVDGVCLTITNLGGREFVVQISPETITKTTFKLKKPGHLVNLERALRLGDRLGGHLVTGHVDGLGLIQKITKLGDYMLFQLALPEELSIYLVPKGSIAVDGISLTVNEVSQNIVKLMVIPHTLSVTTLGHKKAGDFVNIEVDILAKMAYRFLEPYRSRTETKEGSLSEEFLKQHGFA